MGRESDEDKALKAAVKSGDSLLSEQALRAFPGGINGQEPPDYVAKRPIHTFVYSLPYAPADQLQALCEHVFSLDGLNLTCRSLPHGFLSQVIAATNWDPSVMKTVLKALAAARGIETKDLLVEAAAVGGKPTPSALYLALFHCLDTKDSSRVRALLELGAPVDERARALLENEPVKPVDLTVEWITLRNTKPIRRRLLAIVNGEADVDQEEEVDEQARRSKRPRHRQYYK